MNKEEQNPEFITEKALSIADVMAILPSDDDAGIIAVNIASNVEPKLTAQEESFFIAGFTECIKYLRMQEKGN